MCEIGPRVVHLTRTLSRGNNFNSLYFTVCDWKWKCDSTAFVTFTWKIICFLRTSSIRFGHKHKRKLKLNQFFTELMFIMSSLMLQTNRSDMFLSLQTVTYCSYLFLSVYNPYFIVDQYTLIQFVI